MKGFFIALTLTGMIWFLYFGLSAWAGKIIVPTDPKDNDFQAYLQRLGRRVDPGLWLIGLAMVVIGAVALLVIRFVE